MSNETAEYILLFIFLTAQLAVCGYNIFKITRYEQIFSAKPHFRLAPVWPTPELLARAGEDDFSLGVPEFQVENDDYPPVNLIFCENPSPVLKNILSATNRYLLHNNMAAADFHLIKDIADRNIDAVEEDINQTISVPLYLGLMATMFGII